MKRKHITLLVFFVLLILTLGFTWYNSTESIQESKAISTSLLQQLRPLLDAVFGPGVITEHILRKTAHFLEFMLLGIELRLIFWLLGQHGLQGQANALFSGLAAAVTDETIQIFYKRGAQVQDVVLDFCGVFTGALLLFLIALLSQRRRDRRG